MIFFFQRHKKEKKKSLRQLCVGKKIYPWDLKHIFPWNTLLNQCSGIFFVILRYLWHTMGYHNVFWSWGSVLGGLWVDFNPKLTIRLPKMTLRLPKISLRKSENSISGSILGQNRPSDHIELTPHDQKNFWHPIVHICTLEYQKIYQNTDLGGCFRQKCVSDPRDTFFSNAHMHFRPSDLHFLAFGPSFWDLQPISGPQNW